MLGIISCLGFLAIATKAQNEGLLQNPGFESGQQTPWGFSGSSTGTVTAENPHSGSYAL